MSVPAVFAELLTSPRMLLWLMTGTSLGIVVGAIPGLTGAMLIALTLPLTFGMDGGEALVLLVSMYVGSISGGLVTATLLRMPGTPASMMTTLDGYPLAKSGRPAAPWGSASAPRCAAAWFRGVSCWRWRGRWPSTPPSWGRSTCSRSW